MKQFTEKELLELKYDVAHRLETKDSYKDLIFVYYTSLEVLQYFDSLDKAKVSQLDLQFWTHANESAIRYAPQIEDEILPLFKETMEFEDSVERAREKCSKPYTIYDWKRYRMLRADKERKKEYYQNLRRLAGIYLDILSDEPEGEHYQQWLGFYNRLSDCIFAPKRGLAKDDENRLSLAEMKMFLKQFKALKDKEPLGLEVLEYWLPLIDQFEKIIARRKAE